MSTSVTETGCQMKPSQVDHEVFEMDCLYQRPKVVVRDSPSRWFTKLTSWRPIDGREWGWRTGIVQPGCLRDCLNVYPRRRAGCWFEEVQPVCPRVVPVLWKATDVLAPVVRGCQLVRLHLSHQIAHNTRVHQGNILCLTRVRVKVEQAWRYVRFTGQLIWKIKLW